MPFRQRGSTIDDTVARIMMMVGPIQMTAMMMTVHLGGEEKDVLMEIKMVGPMEMLHTSAITSPRTGSKP